MGHSHTILVWTFFSQLRSPYGVDRPSVRPSKIRVSSLTTTHSARNLGFIFDEHLTFSDQIIALSKSCYYHIRELRCISTSKQPAPLPPRLSILKLITLTMHNLQNYQLN